LYFRSLSKINIYTVAPYLQRSTKPHKIAEIARSANIAIIIPAISGTPVGGGTKTHTGVTVTDFFIVPDVKVYSLTMSAI
jgi:hypothetical protein